MIITALLQIIIGSIQQIVELGPVIREDSAAKLGFSIYLTSSLFGALGSVGIDQALQ